MPKKDDSTRMQAVPSTMAIRKHPVHPALVDFPIVFLSAAPVTDLLFWRTGGSLWSEFSFWLLLAGSLSGLAAVFTGLVDFLTIERARARPAGWTHFVLADLAVFLSILNWTGRVGDRQGFILFSGLALSTAVAASLIAAGYFGGLLVFRDLIGVYGPDQDSY